MLIWKKWVWEFFKSKKLSKKLYTFNQQYLHHRIWHFLIFLKRIHSKNAIINIDFLKLLKKYYDRQKNRYCLKLFLHIDNCLRINFFNTKNAFHGTKIHKYNILIFFFVFYIFQSDQSILWRLLQKIQYCASTV